MYNNVNPPGGAGLSDNADFGPGGQDLVVNGTVTVTAPAPETSHVLLAAVGALVVAGFTRRAF